MQASVVICWMSADFVNVTWESICKVSTQSDKQTVVIYSSAVVFDVLRDAENETVRADITQMIHKQSCVLFFIVCFHWMNYSMFGRLNRYCCCCCCYFGCKTRENAYIDENDGELVEHDEESKFVGSEKM